MKIFCYLACLIVVILTGGCQKGETKLATAEELEKVKKVGEAASQALLTSLGSQLKAALQAGGPVPAMQACQQVAPLSTVAIGDNYEGVTIRRTTLKTRNPGNAPDAIDQKVLKYLQDLENIPTEHIEWTEDKGRYYKPLVIQEVCLKCHGDASKFSTDLVGALGSLYPEDQATGYGLGELRGVIRVDVERPGR